MDSDIFFVMYITYRVMSITVSKVRLAPVIAQSHLLSEATAGSRGIPTGRSEPLGQWIVPLPAYEIPRLHKPTDEYDICILYNIYVS